MHKIKIKFFKLKAILLGLLTTLPLIVLAQSTTELDNRKTFQDNYFILGVKSGWGHYQNACEERAVKCDDSDVAWSGFIGYQFHPNLSLEVSYNDFGQAIAQYPENGALKKYTGSMQGWEFSLKGNYALTEKFDWFAKAGTLRWNGDNVGPYSTFSDQDWALTIGTGLEYKITPAWTARFEYQYFDSVGSEILGGSNIHFTSVGISYQFGQTNK